MKNKKKATNTAKKYQKPTARIPLLTPLGRTVGEVPWAREYPRPQLCRDSFLCLNGRWELTVTEGRWEETYTVRVPFAPETRLSGVFRTFTDRSVLTYRRRFSLPQGFRRERVLLHFGAVDAVCEVAVNGTAVAQHEGGYEPFSVDITEQLAADNLLTVTVRDDMSRHTLPYGKQRRRRGGMWYTPTTGIWQTVWCESVPRTFVRSLRIDTDAAGATLTAEGVTEGTVVVWEPDGARTYALTGGVCRIEPATVRLWSPEDPYLYRLTLVAGEDRIESYFALRTLTVETVGDIPRLCLNGKPYFFHALLDQGYTSDGGLTPADPAQYTEDILYAKSLGFNTLRKHIKVECERFYYDCDRLGMIVFQDMVNAGDYRFLRDTALPTLGRLVRRDTRMHRDARMRDAFIRHMEATVTRLYNHPSVCLYTVFNEGWGQFCSTDMYHRLRALDPTRFVDSASGWFMGGESDVVSRHIYFKRVKISPAEKPVILSEFGGYSYRPSGHVENPVRTYGYGRMQTREAFVSALRRLYLEQVVPAVRQGLCAAVYTQLSDVEDETNGLVTYDRKVRKVTPEEMTDIAEALKDAVRDPV